MDEIILLVQRLLTEFGLKILGALAILILGIWVSKLVKSIIKRIMRKAGVDPTLISFVGNLSYVALLAFVIIAALGQLGVQTASFVAILGAAGLAVGLALQGSLANFAAGILMIIFRPFKVGDFIQGAGATGFVEAIEVFTTTIKTLENQFVIIPNGKLAGDNIINYSTDPNIRVDLVVGISAGANVDHAKAIIADVLSQDKNVAKDPAPTIAVLELLEYKVNLAVRPYTNITTYWDVYFDNLENIKKRLDAEGIAGPVPQREVYTHQN